MTSIKGHNSVEKLRKMTIYNIKVDLVNHNVYTKFGLDKSILSQDIKQKLNSDFWLQRYSCLKLWTRDDERRMDAGPWVYYKLTYEPSAQES